MKLYQEAIERRKISPFVFGVKKEKLWGALLFGIAAGIVLFFIRLLLKLEENMLYDYEQLKIRRYGEGPLTAQEGEYFTRKKPSF